MSNILTPVSLWKNFDDTLPVQAEITGESTEDGIKTQYLSFYGRETGAGRVKIYAAFAQDTTAPADDAVILLPDSSGSVDGALMNFFVRRGYSVLMPDDRGKTEGAENYTVYPENVAYANYSERGRYRDFADEDALHTSWYEWVAVAKYCYNYLKERGGVNKIGVVGLRDGGEIGWKLATIADLACLVTVCAAGWMTYGGYHKFGGQEPQFDEERHRFIAGIDSQAYAPFVRCPVLMLCSTNDERFDYDRAYDTFSRINENYVGDSVISYSVHCNGCIDVEGTNDMFLFLDKFVRERQVFLPKPAVITIMADEEQNLIARAEFDQQGVPEEFGMFMAEDCIDSVMREWTPAPYKGGRGGTRDFYLNIYEKTAVVFAFCYARYTNGFTVWSRMAVRKVSGKFRNMRKKCRVIYTARGGADSLSIADRSFALGGIFLTSDAVLPQVVEKADGLKGAYSVCGLMTYRLNNPCYSPSDDAILKMDVFCDNPAEVVFTMRDMDGGEKFVAARQIAGGIWQSVLLESKDFKNGQGMHLASFNKKLRFSIVCDEQYAVNNVMWL